jgi:hypothetical protein
MRRYEEKNYSVCGFRFAGACGKRRRILHFGGLLGSVFLASRDGFPRQSSHGVSTDSVDLHRRRESVSLHDVFPGWRIFAFASGMAVCRESADEK